MKARYLNRTFYFSFRRNVMQVLVNLTVFLYALASVVVHTQEIYSMCEREGEIAFTYDQGPSQYTGRLLQILSKHKIKGTFHISPDYLDNPVILAYLRKAAMDGHLIGVFVKEAVDEEKVKDYLKGVSSVIRRYTNYAPQFLRFPAPGPSPNMLKIVTGLGYSVTTYNLDSLDYNAINEPVTGGQGGVFQNFKEIIDQILPPAKGSFISIQRDIVQSSVEQSDAIISYALDKGYKAVRLDKCISKSGKPSGPDENEKPGDDKTKKKGSGKEGGSAIVEEDIDISLPVDDKGTGRSKQNSSSAQQTQSNALSILFTILATLCLLAIW